MGQFHVHENRNTATRRLYPLLLDIQSNLLSDLRTTVVVPLTPASATAGQALTRLTPVVQIEEQAFIVMTPQLAVIDRHELGPIVGDLSTERTPLINALDFLVSGV